MIPRRTTLRVFAASLLIPALGSWALVAANRTPDQDPPESQPAVVSASAQRVYEQARGELLQIRTLLQGQESQSSVGSGFLVSDEGHIITNYHVVSEAALEPERYRLVYSTADRAEGPLQLLAFDAIHDLALVKAGTPGPLAGRRPLRFRPATSPLAQGDRIYSLGKPLDVGFAVTEGNYNDLVERSFYPTIFFSGSLNPGVSGGPTLDHQGQVIGINVAARMDGEQVSFLVPAAFAEDLLQRARQAPAITASAYPELTTQLTAHQAALTERFLAQPWRSAAHPRYTIPVPQDAFMRCWGSRLPSETKGLQYESSQCAMVTRLFVSGYLTTGSITVRHGVHDGSKLGALRFADRYSDDFGGEYFGIPGEMHRTPAQCHERFVDRGGLPLRAVLCVTAYKKLRGLYDVSVLVATIDAATSGVMGRFNAQGVSFDNALSLASHYLEGFGWTTTATAAR
jgi:S1-C subfamily serine protease